MTQIKKRHTGLLDKILLARLSFHLVVRTAIIKACDNTVMTTSEDILGRIWQSLHEATTQGTGFTLSFLGTIGLEGQPRMRAVILRQFHQAQQQLCFATNIHSAKIPEIRRHPQVALTSYDAGSSIQLRMEGHADIVKDRVCRQRAWRSLAAHSQELYASTNIPGTPLQNDDAGRNSDLASSFARFAWVSVKLEWLDWLDLSDNQRWQFKRRGDQWHGGDVVP